MPNNYDTNPRGRAIDPMDIALEAAWAQLEQGADAVPPLVPEPVVVSHPVQARQAPPEVPAPPADAGVGIFESGNRLPVIVQPHLPAVPPRANTAPPNPDRRRKGIAIAAVAVVALGIIEGPKVVDKFSGGNTTTTTTDKPPVTTHHHPGKPAHKNVKVHHPNKQNPAQNTTSPSAHPSNFHPYTMVGPKTAPTSESTQQPTTPGKPGAGVEAVTIKIGTLNMHGSIHTAKFGPQSGPERTKQQSDLIEEKGLAVINTQENEKNQRTALMKHLGKHFGIIPKVAHYGVHNRHINSVNSIVYDKRLVRPVSVRDLVIRYFNGWKFHIPVVKFQVVGTNIRFYDANTHNPAKPRWAYYRYLDSKREIKEVRHIMSHASEKISGFFFGGDFNSKKDIHAQHNPVWRDNPNNSAVSVMTQSGQMVDGFCAPKHTPRTEACPKDTTRETGANDIDHIFVWKMSRTVVRAYHYIADKSRTASDHGLTYITAKLFGAPSNSKKQ